MDCVSCGIHIPKERLKALPETEYCVKCSPTKKTGDISPDKDWEKLREEEILKDESVILNRIDQRKSSK